jgi:hypothetical protein
MERSLDGSEIPRISSCGSFQAKGTRAALFLAKGASPHLESSCFEEFFLPPERRDNVDDFRSRLGDCDILGQGSIELIGYSYQQVATSFSEAHQQRTPRLRVLGPEQFEDG